MIDLPYRTPICFRKNSQVIIRQGMCIMPKENVCDGCSFYNLVSLPKPFMPRIIQKSEVKC